MKLKGICRRSEIRDDDCILIRDKGDLIVMSRGEVHPADERFWDDVLAPVLSRTLIEMNKDALLDPPSE